MRAEEGSAYVSEKAGKGHSLTEKGTSVVPILQSICRWSGIFYKEETDTPLPQCQRCDYR